jgi:hypothetical protein
VRKLKQQRNQFHAKMMNLFRTMEISCRYFVDQHPKGKHVVLLDIHLTRIFRSKAFEKPPPVADYFDYALELLMKFFKSVSVIPESFKDSSSSMFTLTSLYFPMLVTKINRVISTRRMRKSSTMCNRGDVSIQKKILRF